MNHQILQGNALEKLKELETNSIDLMETDPPYGYSFMKKDWDKAIINVDIWKECLRVLKPGAFAFVMSAPRQDVLSHMIVNLSDAGFKTNFTSIYWAYASGFPKAANISKFIDKKLGKRRKVVETKEKINTYSNIGYSSGEGNYGKITVNKTISSSDQAKKLDNSYAGFQPKPALEVILVCMKPLAEKSYVGQAISNEKGITWLDDVRIPFVDDKDAESSCWDTEITHSFEGGFKKLPNNHISKVQGRFPANLLVSDDVLNNGKITKLVGGVIKAGNTNQVYGTYDKDSYALYPNDLGSFSRYFDLDAWQAQFLIVEKASKSEKNKGLEDFTEHKVNDGRKIDADNAFQRGKTKRKNTHPTVKPITLMSYLITMGSREGDTILDPFTGSGTTLIAASLLNRNSIGIELNPHYCSITKKRLEYWKNKSFDKLEKIKKQVDKNKIQPLETFT